MVLLNEKAFIPQKQTERSSGFDLFSSEDKILKPRCFELISTGISIEIPRGYEAQVRPRSGLAAKNGVTVLNSPGTIDADYRGEIKVCLINHSDKEFKITVGTRIAQMVFSEVKDAVFHKSERLTDTNRGAGGFGSTGLK
ncbi:MAG TPA: dUTP diphosphatase [Spirochaetota bacterium]|nr:dUTP diphosphatase [Spirochaetota bacterium]